MESTLIVLVVLFVMSSQAAPAISTAELQILHSIAKTQVDNTCTFNQILEKYTVSTHNYLLSFMTIRVLALLHIE